MIKKLFLILFMLVLLVILSPFILLGLMYQGDLNSALPIDSYVVGLTPGQTVSTEIDTTLSQLSTPDQDVSFVLSEDLINTLIFSALTQEEGLNPEYDPGSTCETDACQYLVSEAITDSITGHLKAIWVELSDDQITINAGAAVEWSDRFTYSTRLGLTFNITDDEDAYRLSIDRIVLGRLPITSRVLGWVFNRVETATGQPVIESGELPIGTIDTDTFSITIPKADIVQSIRDDEEMENSELVAELLAILFDNNILNFKLENQAFVFNFRSSLLLSDEATTMPARIQELYASETEIDLDAYLQDRFEEFLLSQALLGETSFRLSQRFFNTIIASGFTAGDGLPDFSPTYEDVNGQEQTIEMRVEGFWVTLLESEFVIQALFRVTSFPSLLEITLEKVPSSDPFAIVYEIKSLTLGRSISNPNKPYLIITDFDAFIPFLSDFVETEFIRFNTAGQLVIGGSELEVYMNGFLEGSGVTLSEIEVVDGAMVLGLALDPELQGIFDTYASAINDVLQSDDFINALNTALDVTNNPDAQEVMNQLTSIQTKLNNNEPVTSEDVADLLNEFDDLSTAEQEAFFNIMQGFIDPSVVEEFENSFNQ